MHACVYVCNVMYECVCMDVCMFVSKSAASQSATVLEAGFSQACSGPGHEAGLQRFFSGLKSELYVGAKKDP